MPKGSGPGDDLEPLTPQQRMNWNRFLRFAASKGYYGNTVLDDRTKDTGKDLMRMYNEANKDYPVSYDMVPEVQREFQYFHQNGVFPGFEGPMADSFKKFIAATVRNKAFSPVDSWFGSLTSQEAYPEITDDSGHKWGTNYGAFLKSMVNKYGQ